MAIVNLIRTAESIALSATAIQQQIDSTGEAVLVPAQKLKAKIPELKVLADDTSVARIYAAEDGSYRSQTLTIYLNSKGEPQLHDAALRPINNATFGKFVIGSFPDTYQEVVIGGQAFKVAIARSKQFAENQQQKNDRREGKGKPPADAVSHLPHPAIPLKALEEDRIYTALAYTGISEEYKSQCYRIRDEEEKREFEIFSNRSFEELASEKQMPFNFVVTAKIPTEDGKVIVKLESAEAPSFADLTI